ncbi:MAG: hypothetical protein EKK54_03360 [Neisseriaceae bacterium]|nr:MAG: hypothetical protein EKK54_03360 [Neisseriaceae bacterium]
MRSKLKLKLKNNLLLGLLISGALYGCNGSGANNNATQQTANQGAVTIVPLPGRASLSYLKDSSTANNKVLNSISLQVSAGTDITAANSAVTTAKNIATAIGFGSEFLGPLSIFTSFAAFLSPLLSPSPNYQGEINVINKQISDIYSQLDQIKNTAATQEAQIQQVKYFVTELTDLTANSTLYKIQSDLASIATGYISGTNQATGLPTTQINGNSIYPNFIENSYQSACATTESNVQNGIESNSDMVSCIQTYAQSNAITSVAGNTSYVDNMLHDIYQNIPDLTGYSYGPDANNPEVWIFVKITSGTNISSYLGQLKLQLQQEIAGIQDGSKTGITVSQAITAYNNSIVFMYNQIASGLLQSYTVASSANLLNFYNAVHALSNQGQDLNQISMSNAAHGTKYFFDKPTTWPTTQAAIDAAINSESATFTNVNNNLQTYFISQLNGLETTVSSYMISDPFLPNQKIPAVFNESQTIELNGYQITLQPYATIYNNMQSAKAFIQENGYERYSAQGNYTENSNIYQYNSILDYSQCDSTSCPQILPNTTESMSIQNGLFQVFTVDNSGSVIPSNVLNLNDCDTPAAQNPQVEIVLGNKIQCTTPLSTNTRLGSVGDFSFGNWGSGMQWNSGYAGGQNIYSNSTSFYDFKSNSNMNISSDNSYINFNGSYSTGSGNVTILLPNGVKVPISIEINNGVHNAPYYSTQDYMALGAPQGDNFNSALYSCTATSHSWINCTTINGDSYQISIIQETEYTGKTLLSVTNNNDIFIPTGSYTGSCTYIATLPNHVAVASCNNGGSTWLGSNYDYLNFQIVNPNDTLDNNHGYLHNASTSGVGNEYPGGTYLNSCYSIYYENGVIHAQCKLSNGNWTTAKAQASVSATCTNDNGILTCLSPGVPSGDWANTCSQINIGNTFLTASCSEANGVQKPAWQYIVADNNCSNQNGTLTCSNTPSNPGGFPTVYTISSGFKFTRGNSYSQFGTYFITLQSDGNLVAYTGSPGDMSHAMWASYSNSPDTSIVEVDFQNDGNLVAYDANHNAKWASRTNGKGATLEFQGDGNMVVYDSNHNALWSARDFM